MSDTNPVLSYTFKCVGDDVVEESARVTKKANDASKRTAQQEQGKTPATTPSRENQPLAQPAQLSEREEENRQRRQELRPSGAFRPRPGSIAGGAAQLFQTFPALRNITGVQDPNAAGNAVSALLQAAGHRSSLGYRLTRAASALAAAHSFVGRARDGGIPKPARRPSPLTDDEREEAHAYLNPKPPFEGAPKQDIEGSLREDLQLAAKEGILRTATDRRRQLAMRAVAEKMGINLGTFKPASGPAGGFLSEASISAAANGGGIVSGIGEAVAGRGGAAIGGGGFGKAIVGAAGAGGGPPALPGVGAGGILSSLSGAGGAALPIGVGIAALALEIRAFTKVVGEMTTGVKGIVRGTLHGDPSEAIHGAIHAGQSYAGGIGFAVGGVAGPIGSYVGQEMASKLVGTLHGIVDSLDEFNNRLKDFNPILAGENLKFGLEVKMLNIQLAGKLQPLLTDWIKLKEGFLQKMSDLIASPLFSKFVLLADGLVKKLGPALDYVLQLTINAGKAFLALVTYTGYVAEAVKAIVDPLNIIEKTCGPIVTGFTQLEDATKYLAYGFLKAASEITRYLPGDEMQKFATDSGILADNIDPRQNKVVANGGAIAAGPTLQQQANDFAKNFLAALNIQAPVLSSGGSPNADPITGVAPNEYLNTGKLPGFIPGRAAGGPVDPKQIYKVGENGEEIFIPNVPGWIATNAESRQFDRIKRLWGDAEAKDWIISRAVWDFGDALTAQMNRDLIAKGDKDPRDQLPRPEFHWAHSSSLWHNTVSSVDAQRYQLLALKFGPKKVNEILSAQHDADVERTSAWRGSDSRTKPLSGFMSKLTDRPYLNALAWQTRMNGGGYIRSGLDTDTNASAGTIAWRDPKTFERKSDSTQSFSLNADPGTISVNGSVVRRLKRPEPSYGTNSGSMVGTAVMAGDTTDDDGPPLTGGPNSMSAMAGQAVSSVIHGDHQSSTQPPTPPPPVASNPALINYQRSQQTPATTSSQSIAARTPGPVFPAANLGMNFNQNNDFTVSCDKEIDTLISEVRRRLLQEFNVVQSETRLLAALIDGDNAADLM